LDPKRASLHRGKLASLSIDHLVGEGEELWWNFEAESLGGIELIASSNLVGCMTGMSAGLASFRMLPV
jgi:hypothetical protein